MRDNPRNPSRPTLMLLLAALWCLGGAADVRAQATLVDIATDATDPLDLGDSEPSIAVNPTNPMEIAVVSFSENWGPGVMAPVWRSNDGGATWNKVFQIPQPAAGLNGPGDQKIVFDHTGRLLIAELGLFPIQNFIFRQTGAANDPLTVGVSYGYDQPHLEIDNAPASACFERIYSPWLDFSGANQLSTVANSADQGVTMADVAAGDNSSFSNRTTRIALAPNGRAYIVYKTREGSVGGGFENAHFRVNRSDDCGASWNAIGAAGVSVHGAPAVQTWFTNDFGNPAKGKVARARSSDTWIAVDPGDGDVYVAYTHRDGSGFGQIFVVRSTTEGVTWGAPVRVTDGTHNAAFPEIAVAQNGAVGVLYVDYDDSGANTIFRHRFARSFDDGASWSDQILQSMDPGPLANAASGFLWGDYEGLTAHGDTFYGVFTGESIGRTPPQLDPIFFSESASPAATPTFLHWSWSVHGGLNEPQNPFSMLFGGAFSGGLDLEYRFDPTFALELFLGYDEFDGQILVPDVELLHLALNGKAYFGPGPTRTVVIAGIGSYDFSPGPSETGVNAGVGVQFNVGPTLAAEVTGKYHAVQTPGPDFEFVTLHGGLRFRF